MNGFGLSRGRFALLFSVMLVAAAGNTAMQSLLPAIGRQLEVADIWVAIAFSLSAIVWVVLAPVWAHRADRRGRRALMRLGLYGFIASMLVCGGALAVGLAGYAGGMIVFTIFMLGRTIYGAFGSASPPAVQAYVAARTDGEARTAAMALLVLKLPDDTPRSEAKGRIVAYPAIGGGGAEPAPEESVPASLSWRDRRVLPWHLIGIAGGHGHAVLLGVIGFLVIDRLSLSLDQAQQWIAIVLIAGAAASLFAQWWLIPRLGLDPRQLILWGALVAAAGSAMTGLASGVYGLTLGFALASLGFGLFRPGFTSGASLAVGPDEQNEVAGQVTSVNGVAFVAGPAAGVGLYMMSLALPFLVTAALMLVLAIWTWLRFSPSAPAE